MIGLIDALTLNKGKEMSKQVCYTCRHRKLSKKRFETGTICKRNFYQDYTINLKHHDRGIAASCNQYERLIDAEEDES